MDNLNNYNIFVINLERRKDRLDHFSQQAKHLDKYEVFTGWDAKIQGLEKSEEKLKEFYNDKTFYSLSSKRGQFRGRIGVVISFLSLLKVAIERDLDNILVFEDDILINNKLTFTSPPDDSILSYLSGFRELYPFTQKLDNNNDWELIENYKVWECHSMIIKGKKNIKKVYHLLTNHNCRPRALDSMLIKYVQKKERTYLYKEGTFMKQHRVLSSDITFIHGDNTLHQEKKSLGINIDKKKNETIKEIEVTLN